MASDRPLSDRLAPDTIRRLQRAARLRFAEAGYLEAKNRLLGAIYLYGYTVEMCLCAASFRVAGFAANAPIARDVRARRMAQARRTRANDGKPLMDSDPHPLVGWARFLDWQRSAARGRSSRARLSEDAVGKATQAYQHWRPELRYKTTDVTLRQLAEVREAASWFLGNQDRI
jgi:hypothetical protein